MSREFVKAQSDNLPLVTGEMVAHYFSSSEHYNVVETRGVKDSRSKRESYGDNAVGYVELKREGNLCIIQGRICPEHKVRSTPYSVSCTVDEVENEIVEIQCRDCAASAGGCKHGTAFLIRLHRRSEEPEPTATVCYWKKSKLAKVGTTLKSISIGELASGKQTTKGYPSNETFFEKITAHMKMQNLNFEISPHCYHNKDEVMSLSLHQLLSTFGQSGKTGVDEFLSFATISMSKEVCEKVERRTITQSESLLWMEMRYGRITASILYEIAHCHTPEGTLVDKITGTSKIKDNEAMARGRNLEKRVLAELAHHLPCFKFKDAGLFLNPMYPILGASSDAKGADFVVEIKCPATEKTEKTYLTSLNEIANRYKVQIQLQMFMTGKKLGYFCVAKPDFETSLQFTLICEKYKENYITDIINKGTNFWRKNVFPILYRAAVPADGR